MSHHSDYNEQNEDSGDLTFAKFLKHNCQTTHDSVDNLVMSVKPFDSTDNYIKFLQLQAVFHKVVDNIYKNPKLNQQIEGLAKLARYDEVLRDLQDLNASEKKHFCAIATIIGSRNFGLVILCGRL